MAKDFGIPSKSITEILGTYSVKPRNHMQPLSEGDLSIIFDYLTQRHQISNIQSIYDDTAKPEPRTGKASPKAEEAPKAEEVAKAEPAPVEEVPTPEAVKADEAPKAVPDAKSEPRKADARPAKSADNRGGGRRPDAPKSADTRPAPKSDGGRPAPQSKPADSKPAQQSKPAAQSKPAPQKSGDGKPAAPKSRVPQRKIVDTRKGGDVNLAKYDERLEDLGGQRGERMQQKAGKEKFRNSQRQNRQQAMSVKRRQDEAERLRRLKLEVARKSPVKVS
ncbi:MAG: translation initiation factor IF-2, partial [Oscillibacter sp.]|nr:translation initiation factor IF-2 [Oscillibacter sp.]